MIVSAWLAVQQALFGNHLERLTFIMIELFQQILKCKWTLLILDRCHHGFIRPGELRRSITGLSAKVLYERLKLLEEGGVLERELIAEKPVEVHYRLTDKGLKVCDLIARIKNLD